jgi:hypothetical protein
MPEPSANEVRSIPVELTVRPLRRAYLVPSDAGAEQVRQCIAESSQAWGGWGDILVPYDPDPNADDGIPPVFRALLRRHSPDTVEFIGDMPPSIPRQVARLVDLLPAWNEPTGILEFGRAPGRPRVTSLRELGVMPVGYRVHYPTTAALLLAAYAGVAPEYAFASNRASRTIEGPTDAVLREISRLCKRPIRPGPSGPVAGTSFAAGMQGLGVFHNPSPTLLRHDSLLVVGDSLSDFCLFYALLHTGFPVPPYWLPTSAGVGDPANARELDEAALAALMPRRDSTESRGTRLVTSVSLSEAEAIAVAASGWSAYTSASCPQAAESRPAVGAADGCAPQTVWGAPGPELASHTAWLKEHETTRPRVRAIAVLRGSDILAPVPPVTPATAEPGRLEDWSWVTDVSVPRMHAYPSRACVRGLVVALGEDTQAGRGRSTRRGAAFTAWRETSFVSDLEHQLTPLLFRNPDPREVMRAIFADAGLEIALSDAGRYTRQAAEAFGGLPAFSRTFKGVEGHILDCLVGRSEPGDQAQSFADEEGRQRRPHPSLTNVTKWLGETDTRLGANAKRAAEDLVSSWLASGILRRGVVHKCVDCALEYWYPVEQVAERIVCRRCGHSTPMALEPRWLFRPSEVVYQAVSRNCLAPILTLQRVCDQAQAFAWVEEHTVSDRSGKVPDMELDILCFADGELVLGEAKTIPSLCGREHGDDPDDVREDLAAFRAKYLSLAERVLPDRLVFATTAEGWDAASSECIERIRVDVSPYATRVDEWTREDLIQDGSA